MATLRLMIVDDEEGMRLSVTRALRSYSIDLPEIHERAEFEVEAAASGEEALERIAAEAPDILLLDYKLPGMDGLEILERVEAAEHEILVIMITAYASLETAVTAIKRGAYDFLAKPFTPDELKATVGKAAQSLIMAQEARRLAKEKRRVRFEFVSVLAHELKAPLAAIDGYLQVMKRRCAGDDLSAYDHAIERSLIRSEYMQKMIVDLLDLTRIESGQKRRERSRVDVVEVARDVADTVAPEAERRGIRVEVQAPSPAQMSADRGEIEILLNNLVSNAVKYNREGGRVEIQVSREGDQVAITVADNGIGMTEEEAGRLFGEFVRIRNKKTHDVLGNGLGLSIVKKLALLYEGSVTVESEPDVGSSFTVTLKTDSMAEGAASAEAGVVETSPSGPSLTGKPSGELAGRPG